MKVIFESEDQNEINKVVFESEDPTEIKRLAKANDMADFIWELKHNAWRRFKHTDYDWEKSWEVINELLADFNINTEDLA
jgi:hypothetical protein